MTNEQRPLPLKGIRVLDLGQFIAIPYATLWLAWLGAEVILIESGGRSTTRSAPPFAPGFGQDPNASGYFNTLFSSKKSCTVDMTKPAGRTVVRRLAEKVDVMVDNFSTGVLEKLGLVYDELKVANPGLIVASNGAFGREGPMAKARGLHSAVNLFSGVSDVLGYVDGHPRILGGCIPDPLSGIYSVFGILSALYKRRRTGKGQFIDIAMYEAMVSLIPEAVIDYSMNGATPKPRGNRDVTKAPFGIYRCLGDDQWVAISTETEEEWAALCRAAGHMDWRESAAFATVADRLANVEALDAAIEGWTRTLEPEAAAAILRGAGVAAQKVLRVDELLENEQLQARGQVIAPVHPLVGPRQQLGLPWQSDGFSHDYRPAPLLGADTREVLGTLLGMGDAEFEQLTAEGVLK